MNHPPMPMPSPSYDINEHEPTLSSLHGGSHESGLPSSDVNNVEEQHWRHLEMFFAENEQAIQRAEKSSLESKVEDVKIAVGVFIDTTKVVLDGLSALAKVHPALGVAIVAFSGIISLDLTRRENDQKVIAVKLEMQTMMCAMFQFRKLRYRHVSEADRTAEESGLRRLMKTIAGEIKVCGSDLRYYSERNTLARAISSKLYERRFAGHVEVFVQRRSELQTAVSAYMSAGMDAANLRLESIGNAINTMDQKIDTILPLFQKLQTSRERDLLQFMADNGGSEKCVDEDRLLTRLLAMAGESPKASASGSDAREQQQQLNAVRKDLKNDMKHLESILTKNLSRFENLLQIQSNNLRSHMQDTSTKLDQIYASAIQIIDQGKLIEKAVIPSAASSASLKDPVMQRVWGRMGLRGSVKAKTFILNFRDHIAMDRSAAGTPINGTPRITNIELGSTNELKGTSQSEVEAYPSTDQAIFSAEYEDDWALRYLTVSNVLPITEAIDEDCSGFISVKEANKFAQARPPGRSLISWMAYWATGWHRNLTEYKSNIYSTIFQLHYLSNTALPFNKHLIKAYLNSYSFSRIDALLRSIKPYSGPLENEKESSMDEYRKTIAELQDGQLTRNLDGISYILRSDSDIKLIAGYGNPRVETWVLPVLYLVLKRHLDVVLLAQRNLIHANEMVAHEISLSVILNAFDERLNGLEGIFQQEYQGSLETHFKAFSYGMFYTSFKWLASGSAENVNNESTLYAQEDFDSYITKDLVDRKLSESLPDMSCLGEGPGERYHYVEDTENLENNYSKHGESHPLEGFWSLRFSRRMPLELLISSVDDGKIVGMITPFDGDRGTLVGDYKTEKGVLGGILDFDLRLCFDNGWEETRYCSATYDPDRELVTGTWSRWAADYPDCANEPRESFVARRTPFDLYITHTDAVDDMSASLEIDENARRRWRFAIDVVRSRTKARTNSKESTLARLNGAKNLIRLYYEGFLYGGDGSMPFEKDDRLRPLVYLGLPRAHGLYKSVAKYRSERLMDHCATYAPRCANCPTNILHVGYQCITCTPSSFFSSPDIFCDLCRDTVEEDKVPVNKNADFIHRPSHSLLRITSRLWIRQCDLVWLIPNARSTSESVKERFRDLASLKVREAARANVYESSIMGNSKATPPPKCSLCDTTIAALPAWVPIEHYKPIGNDELICIECVQSKKDSKSNSTFSNERHLLWVPNSTRVWPDEEKYTRLDERIEKMESRIAAVAGEVTSSRDNIDARMKVLESQMSSMEGQFKNLESQVNTQLTEIKSMIMLALGRSGT